MGAAKKFKDNYPQEKDRTTSNLEDKKMIEAYQQKIVKMLEDPEMQKKAALILQELINKAEKE